MGSWLTSTTISGSAPYNFVKLHKAHKLTPAMAAGITDKLWSVEDIVALVEASEPKPGKRGPYKKHAA
jgi:hypothetical protein